MSQRHSLPVGMNNAKAGGLYQKLGLGVFAALALMLAVAAPAKAGQPGLSYYAYYEGSWDRLPDFASLTPKARGMAAGFDLGVRQRDNDFALLFETLVSVPSAGTYTFDLSSDDGSKLWIAPYEGVPNYTLVVDNDKIHGSATVSGKVTLTPGTYRLLIGYFQYDGQRDLGLKVAGPGSNVPVDVVPYIFVP